MAADRQRRHPLAAGFQVIRRRTLLGAALVAPAVLRAQGTEALTFYYPMAAGGPVQALIDGYCADFKRESGITVTPVYTGPYAETLTKAATAIRAGKGPHFAVLPAAEIHSLQDAGILVSLDEIGLDDAAGRWLGGFYPAFMANSRVNGRTWSVPFQRSALVAYYNKTAFEQGGIKPTYFPTTWAELADTASELVKRTADGRVTRWGLEMAADLGNAQWTFGALANQAGQSLMNEAGNETYFDAPKTIEAMTYWRDLAAKYKASPPGISARPALLPDFLQGDVAIIWHTTRNLTNVDDKAGFPFGVAALPGKDAPHTVVGGGNLYFFKHASPAERAAGLRFARWVSAPERAADWSMHTGYIATSPAAYETAAMKDYLARVPAATVARDVLPAAAGELSTFENQRIQKALTDQIQAVLNGAKEPAQAMADAQAASAGILKPYL
jgi:sn-glycerol 3-phosphate transport system substrate-binding protein